MATKFSARPRGGGRGDERRLIAAARLGDRPALEHLLREAMPPIWRFSRSFCRNDEDAQDLAQDVIQALLRNLPSFRGDASVSTWAFTVARRTCARRRRRSTRMSSLDAPEQADARERPSPLPDPSRRAERRELTTQLEAAISELPRAQREVILMRDVEGRTAEEVATALGIGERAVKSRLHRARTTLRATLADRLGDRPGDRPGDSVALGPRPGCPDTPRLLSRHLEGELDASVCARMEAHVRTCASCRGACRSLRRLLSTCRAFGARPVPPAVRKAVRAAVSALAAPAS